MDEECYFDSKLKCRESDKSKELINVRAKRIENIIRCSKLFNDDVHHELQLQYDNDNELILRVHKVCVEYYVHPKTVKLAVKHKHRDNEEDTSLISFRRARRSENPKFNFLHQCIYCGDECNIQKDRKNPTRWRKAYLCREVERSGSRKSLKEDIFDKCDERNDEWASEVRIRVSGAISDLHAADARYHIDCRTNFMSAKSTASAVRAVLESPMTAGDEALLDVIELLEKDMSCIWNSVELHSVYVEKGGNVLSRHQLVSRLSENFGKDLVVLTSPGIATILAFESRASKVLRIIPDLEDDDTNITINKLKKKICQDIKGISIDRRHYTTHLDYENASDNVSDTVLELLSCLSPKLDRTLPALLIGNIITSVLTNYPTQLQISLAVLLRDSKELVKTMHDFGVTCTYDELLRFKKSVAVIAAKNTKLTSITNAKDGLVQVVVDNFDADISSQNGKLSTHSLAVLMTQPDITPHLQDDLLPRLRKIEMSGNINYELEITRYNGPKKPKIPQQFIKRQILPLKILAHMVVAQKRASETNFIFLKDVMNRDDCPEFNGYNTAISRKEGLSLKPKTNAVYLPLIDMPPAHPDTIMTAMNKAQKLTEETGQDFTLFTADQQLYRVAVEVQWTYPDMFPNVILRLGGMHMLMSFVGAVGSLMAETGLAEILASVFGGVAKMLTGKKFPMNIRAMRMLAEELLRPLFFEDQLNSHDELMTVLENLSTRSRTTKMWVDVFIKPVLIMMMYVKAEREGE